jgi:hypothetical protein
MTKLKHLKKAKYLLGLDDEVAKYSLSALALYCLVEGKITNSEVDDIVNQTKEKLGVE